jgi:hypothetical protein
MKNFFDYSDEIHYESIDVPNGPRLHFISCENASPDSVSISVTVGFGGTNLTCMDELGSTYKFPEGMAHFMEHLLFWQNLNQLKTLQKTYAFMPNAVVTYDFTTWYLRNALVEGLETKESQKIKEVCDIVQRLISVLILNDESKAEVLSKIDRTVHDIEAEITHRHSNFNYKMRLKLLEILYYNNSIRYDMLGNEESLRKVQDCDVKQALNLISTNILSVTVVGKRLSDKLVAKVEQTVLALLSQRPYLIKLRPITNGTEPIKVKKESSGLPLFGTDSDFAMLLVGIKLLPLQLAFPSPDKLKRMYLLSYLTMNVNHKSLRINSIISQNARVQLVKTIIHDSLFFWSKTDCMREVEKCKAHLLQKLEAWREDTHDAIELTFAEMSEDPNDLMKLCHAADLFGYRLTDLLDTFELIESQDVVSLIEEINEARENISYVYSSPH